MSVKLQDRILKVLEKAGEAVPSRELFRKSGAASRGAYHQALAALRQDGRVVADGRTVRLGESAAAREVLPEVEAVMLSLSRGFAFARNAESGEDYYIHISHVGEAMPGDRVLLRRVRTSARGLSAEVARILEPAARQTTGTVLRQEGDWLLRPDAAIRYDLPLAAQAGSRLKEGSKVLASLERGPDGILRAQVKKSYGSAGCARVCADAILDQNGVPHVFPQKVLREARAAATLAPEKPSRSGRLDLRKTTIFTIDGADAKDLDDAISVSRTRKGYRLGVHIADVSYYVKEGGAVDEEARLRGTSVYFADRVVPMLPKELSNGVCSLNAGEDKLAFSALMELDRNGELLSWQFRKTLIRSKVRGVYQEVNEIFSGKAGKELRKKYAPVIRSLNVARELAQVLRQRARARGVMDLESSEPQFTLDEKGVCVGMQPRVQGEAEQMIEELMVTANCAAAKLAREKGLPFVYRVHQKPDPERVRNLARLAGLFGLDARGLHTGEPQPADFSALLRQTEGLPVRKLVSMQVLRTMEKARYSPEPQGHFGLALADYCHFTSPIRRYPDTAVHRILSGFVSGMSPEELVRRYEAFAAQAAAESSRCEVRAMTAERSAEDCYMAEFLSHHIGECFDGTVCGVTARGVFVELESSAEGFVPVESFSGADFHFDGEIAQVDAVSGRRLTIGDALRIRVAAADIATGRIDFVPAEEEPAAPAE